MAPPDSTAIDITNRLVQLERVNQQNIQFSELRARLARMESKQTEDFNHLNNTMAAINESLQRLSSKFEVISNEVGQMTKPQPPEIPMGSDEVSIEKRVEETNQNSVGIDSVCEEVVDEEFSRLNQREEGAVDIQVGYVVLYDQDTANLLAVYADPHRNNSSPQCGTMWNNVVSQQCVPSYEDIHVSSPAEDVQLAGVNNAREDDKPIWQYPTLADTYKQELEMLLVKELKDHPPDIAIQMVPTIDRVCITDTSSLGSWVKYVPIAVQALHHLCSNYNPKVTMIRQVSEITRAPDNMKENHTTSSAIQPSCEAPMVSYSSIGLPNGILGVLNGLNVCNVSLLPSLKTVNGYVFVLVNANISINCSSKRRRNFQQEWRPGILFPNVAFILLHAKKNGTVVISILGDNVGTFQHLSHYIFSMSILVDFQECNVASVIQLHITRGDVKGYSARSVHIVAKSGIVVKRGTHNPNEFSRGQYSLDCSSLFLTIGTIANKRMICTCHSREKQGVHSHKSCIGPATVNESIKIVPNSLQWVCPIWRATGQHYPLDFQSGHASMKLFMYSQRSRLKEALNLCQSRFFLFVIYTRYGFLQYTCLGSIRSTEQPVALIVSRMYVLGDWCLMHVCHPQCWQVSDFTTGSLQNIYSLPLLRNADVAVKNVPYDHIDDIAECPSRHSSPSSKAVESSSCPTDCQIIPWDRLLIPLRVSTWQNRSCTRGNIVGETTLYTLIAVPVAWCLIHSSVYRRITCISFASTFDIFTIHTCRLTIRDGLGAEQEQRLKRVHISWYYIDGVLMADTVFVMQSVETNTTAVQNQLGKDIQGDSTIRVLILLLFAGVIKSGALYSSPQGSNNSEAQALWKYGLQSKHIDLASCELLQHISVSRTPSFMQCLRYSVINMDHVGNQMQELQQVRSTSRKFMEAGVVLYQKSVHSSYFLHTIQLRAIKVQQSQWQGHQANSSDECALWQNMCTNDLYPPRPANISVLLLEGMSIQSLETFGQLLAYFNAEHNTSSSLQCSFCYDPDIAGMQTFHVSVEHSVQSITTMSFSSEYEGKTLTGLSRSLENLQGRLLVSVAIDHQHDDVSRLYIVVDTRLRMLGLPHQLSKLGRILLPMFPGLDLTSLPVAYFQWQIAWSPLLYTTIVSWTAEATPITTWCERRSFLKQYSLPQAMTASPSDSTASILSYSRSATLPKVYANSGTCSTPTQYSVTYTATPLRSIVQPSNTIVNSSAPEQYQVRILYKQHCQPNDTQDCSCYGTIPAPHNTTIPTSHFFQTLPYKLSPTIFQPLPLTTNATTGGSTSATVQSAMNILAHNHLEDKVFFK